MTIGNDFVIISIILELKFPAALHIFAPKGRDKMNKQTVIDDILMSMHKFAMKAYSDVFELKNYSPNTIKNYSKHFLCLPE